METGLKPSLKGSLEFSSNLIKTEGLMSLVRGIGLRTFQGGASYALLYALKREFADYFQDQNPTVKSAKLSAAAGAVENVACRQVLLTATTAVINGDKILNPSMWFSTGCRLPLTTFFRSANFTASVVGRDLGAKAGDSVGLNSTTKTALMGCCATMCSVPFMGFAEVLTQATARGLPLLSSVREATYGAFLAPTDPFMVLREGLFLVPFVFSEPLQSAVVPVLEQGLSFRPSLLNGMSTHE